jgi:penicillin V acylase-like amidase (Ntn superfamily)
MFFLLITIVTSSSACTVFTASQGETVLAGNNEDWYFSETQAQFIPARNDEFGLVIFGFSDGIFQGGMNEKGLFVDISALPSFPLNFHPERVEIKANIAEYALRTCSNVSEVIQLYNTTKFFNSWSAQFLFADASGDAVVIGIDSTGELAFTHKNGNYLLMTNFNLANPDNGRYPSSRYDTGLSMLNSMDNVTVDGFKSILSSVHQKTTLYSNVYDLKNGIVYIYYFHQFQEVVEINLSEELAKGYHIIPLIDLFSAETQSSALAAYQYYQLSAVLAEVVSIVALLMNIVCLSIIAFKFVKKRRNPSVVKSNHSKHTKLIILISLTWTLTFWAYPLLVTTDMHNFIYALYNSLLPLPLDLYIVIGFIGLFVACGSIIRSYLK